MKDIQTTVRALMQQGKGILAADESTGTADARLSEAGVEANEANRLRYREMLLTTPGIERYLSGVILYDETLRQSLSRGVSFPHFLNELGILIGIKVDEGLEDAHGGQVTKGLDGLDARLDEYTSLGARFAKWRAVARVGDGYADPAIRENAERMAAYAATCLKRSVTPIVEPEVLMDGAHSAADAEGALIETIAIVCDALRAADVPFENVILKTAMAVSGKDAPHTASASEVAERTVRALKTSVPDTIGGVVFLSGGQTPEKATEHLNAIARMEPHPWPITFSFARALQAPALAEWAGKDENKDEAQAIFLRRVTLAVAADAGAYSASMEKDSWQ